MNAMIRRAVSSMLIGSVLSLSGCSAFMPRQESVTITTSEPGAEIFINSMPSGKSPLTTMLDRNKNYTVVAKLPGKNGSSSIGKTISPTGVLDIVGTFFFIVPVIGCFTPGFWDLDPTSLQIQMNPN
jgi:hypothetical protein